MHTAARERAHSAASATATTVEGLAVPLSAFVGRSDALDELSALLDTARLLTLTGSGGSGKTRLAAELAQRVCDRFQRAVWVDFSGLHEPGLVPQHVATAVGVREPAHRTPADALCHALGTRRVLLVLDNCEAHLEVCARLTEQLLRACPAVTLLATSRAALGVAEERAWPVPSLSLPWTDTDIRTIAASEAVQLFVSRAQAVSPDFALTPRNALVVARVCRQLDGIPLAIELAAARTRVLEMPVLAERLDRSLTAQQGVPIGEPPRPRTVRATIDWSYRQLDAPEQQMLRQLAVFAGGFSMDAARAVCAAAEMPEDDVPAALASLVDRSLVVVQPIEGSARYRLLDAVRSFAEEALRAAGGVEEVRARHAHFYAGLAAAAEPHLFGGAADAQWMSRLDTEIDNLRALADWCEERVERTSIALETGIALHWYLFARGWLRAGHDRLARAVARGDTVDPLLLARARTALASLKMWRGDVAAIPPLVEPVLDPLHDAGDAHMFAYAMVLLAAARSMSGDVQAATPQLAEAVAAARRQPVDVLLAIARYWQGLNAAEQDDFVLAEEALNEALAIGRRQGHPPSIAHPLSVLGIIATWRAAPGDGERALDRLVEALAVHQATSDRWGLAHTLDGLASAACLLDRPEIAVQFYAAAEALRADIEAVRPPAAQAHIEEAVASIRAALGESAFAEGCRAGALLDAAGIEALARTLSAERAPAARSSPAVAPAVPVIVQLGAAPAGQPPVKTPDDAAS